MVAQEIANLSYALSIVQVRVLLSAPLNPWKKKYNKDFLLKTQQCPATLFE